MEFSIKQTETEIVVTFDLGDDDVQIERYPLGTSFYVEIDSDSRFTFKVK